MKRKYRIMALYVCLIFVLSIFTDTCSVLSKQMTVNAAEDQAVAGAGNSYVFTEESENSSDCITDVRYTDDSIAVDYHISDNAAVVVGLYDDSYSTMYTSVSCDLSYENESVVIPLSDAPEYFSIRAYLLDKNSLQPLGEPFESTLYTEAIQNVKNSTIDDYESDRTFDLGDGNFAVLDDSVRIIKSGKTDVSLISVDQSKQEYRFNDSDEIRNICPGDRIMFIDDKYFYLIWTESAEQVADGVLIKSSTKELEDFCSVMYMENADGNTNIEYSLSDEKYINDSILPDYASIPDSVRASLDLNLPLGGAKIYNVEITNIKQSGIIFKKTRFSLNIDFAVNPLTSDINFPMLTAPQAGLTFGIAFGVKMSETAPIKMRLSLHFFVAGLTGHVIPDVQMLEFEKLQPSKVTIKTAITVGYGASLGNIISANLAELNIYYEISIERMKTLNHRTDSGAYVKHDCTKTKKEIADLEENMKQLNLKLEEYESDPEISDQELKQLKDLIDITKKEIENGSKQCVESELFTRFGIGVSLFSISGDNILTGQISVSLTDDDFDEFLSEMFDLFGLHKKKHYCYYYNCNVHETSAFTQCPQIKYQTGLAFVNKEGQLSKDVIFDIDNGVEISGKEENIIYLTPGKHTVRISGTDLKYQINIKDDSPNEYIFYLDKENNRFELFEFGKQNNFTCISLTDEFGVCYWVFDDHAQVAFGPSHSKSPTILIKESIAGKNVTYINANAFSGCKGIYDINIPYTVRDMGGITQIGVRSFDYICDDEPETVEVYSPSPFYNCQDLYYVGVDPQNENFFDVNGALFKGKKSNSTCTSFGSLVYYPVNRSERVYTIPDICCSVTGASFLGNGRQFELKIGKNISSVFPFSLCSDRITGYNVAPENNVYSSNGKMLLSKDGTTLVSCSWSAGEKVEIPDSVTVIGQSAFLGNTVIKEVYIPETVTVIEGYAFYGSGLRTVHYEGSESSWGSVEKSENYITDEDYIKINYNSKISAEENSEVSYASDIDYVAESNYSDSIISTENFDFDISDAVTDRPEYVPVSIGFQDLQPDQVYYYFIVRSADAPSLLSSDNLLYIGHDCSDSWGDLDISKNISGSAENFNILIRTREGISITEGTSVSFLNSFDGNTTAVVPSVTNNSQKLIPGVDFDVYGTSIIERDGIYTMTIRGKGAFSGSYTFDYIVDKDGSVRIYDAERIAGDINADGNFDAMDILILKSWILGDQDITLNDWKTADFCNDNELNVMDLLMIQRKILE